MHPAPHRGIARQRLVRGLAPGAAAAGGDAALRRRRGLEELADVALDEGVPGGGGGAGGAGEGAAAVAAAGVGGGAQR